MAPERWLQRVWYDSAPGGWVMLPLSWVYAAAAGLRRVLFRSGILPRVRAGVPVVVVGNLTAGGTGKTPLVLWLAERLRQRGLRAGIASRGYGARVSRQPSLVGAGDDPAAVGDEPLLMARRGVARVAVCRRRGDAAGRLVEEGVDVVICDDGLQHYALARDIEIAVIDGRRRFGNGRLIPAGPLREPLSRLQSVDWRVCHGDSPQRGEIGMRLRGTVLRRLRDGRQRPLDDFRGHRCHAVAAVGNPARFFAMLRDAGIDVVEHPLPDHAVPVLASLELPEGEPVIMTEKDAVKCREGDRFDAWALPVDAEVGPGGEQIVDQIARLCATDRGRQGDA